MAGPHLLTRSSIALIGVAMCWSAGVMPGAVEATPWIVDPLFGARGGFETNPRMRDTGGDDTYQLRGTVGARAGQDTGSRQLEFQGEVGYTTYDGGDDAPDDGDFQRLQARTTSRGEVTTWRLDGTALRDNTVLSVFDTTVPVDPDDEIDAGGDVDVRTRDETVTRHRLFLVPSVTRDLTERWSIGAEYSGRYIGFESGGVDDVSSLNHEFQVRTAYDATERLETGLVLQGALFRPRGNQTAFNTYGVGVDLEYRLTERTRLTGLVGVRQTEPHDSDDDADSGTGVVGNVGLRHQGENWRLFTSIERRLRPNARGRLTETDQIRLTVGRTLSPRWETVTTARAFTSRGVDSGLPSGANDEFVAVQPRLSYRLTEDWSVSADYRYEALRRVDSDRLAEAHAGFLGIEYSPRRRY